MSNKLFFKEYEGSIRLGAAHSLITGHGPRLAFLENEAEQRKQELAQFGLFDYASPNFNTYYPDATEEDLQPKEGEFIRPVYRALSEVIVRKNIDPIDFSKDNVLKASMGLLLAQTVYTNHEAIVGNEIGTVSKTFWDPGHVANGVKVPAGINAEFLIDGKAHPGIARKILMDPPAIHSNSVTVTFKWTPSHPKMDSSEFRSKTGTYDNKGELIRRVVSEITAYYETSLVSHGADPFAKQIRDGKIVSPEFAKVRDSFSEKIKGSSQYYIFSYKDSLSDITIPKRLDNNEEGEDNLNNNTPTQMEKELLVLMAALVAFSISEEHLALEQEEFNEAFDMDAFKAHVKEKQPELLANLTELDAVKREKSQLEADLESEKARVTSLQASSDEIIEMKADLLAEVQRLYEASSGKAATDALTATFQKADYTALKSFKDLYGASLEDKYPATCTSCGGTEITRASTTPPEDEVDKTPKGGKSKANFTEIRKSILTGEIELDPNRNY